MKENKFVISDEHPAIAGHFPGHPIVPGVLLISQALAKISLPSSYQLKKVKFLKMVSPGDSVFVSLKTLKSGSYQLQLIVNEQLVLSAKIIEGVGESMALGHPSVKNQVIDASTISQRIPHSGSMCLLQKALYWDENSMLAEAMSHQQASNPLIVHKKGASVLSALVLPEYVSQVIALHGATLACEEKDATDVTAVSQPREGYLAVMPKCYFYCTELQDVTAPLRIYINILLKQENACFYQFSVTADQQLLAEGEVGIVLEKT